ncbi:MAG: hypothetical protein ACRETH_05510, partial [Steroidobacteraceae bacterium]
METRDRQRPPVSPHEHQAANGEDLALGTIAAKTYVEGQRSNRPLSIPIYQAVNFEAPTSEVHRERFRRRASEFYVRFG